MYKLILRHVWLQRLLFGSLLMIAVLNATAQTNWTSRPQSTNRYSLFDIAYGAGRYVTVGEQGLIRVSTDGEVWTTQPTGPLESELLKGIVYANNRFVVVGYNGGVMTSTNGQTWTKQLSGTSEDLMGICYGGGMFVSVGTNGILITSTDGVTWTKRAPGTTGSFMAIAYGGGKFVTGGLNFIKTSTDGINWTTGNLPNFYYSFGGVTAGPNGSFVAVGSNNSVLTSTDGITWVARPVTAGPAYLYLNSVTYSQSLNKYVAIQANGGYVVTSTDGVTWKASSSETSTHLHSVRYLQGKFLVVGQSATIRSSPNGLAWKPVTIEPAISLYGAAFGNGRYVAVGAYSPVYPAYTGNVAITSADGVNYTVGETIHVPNGAKQFNDVTFGNGLFAAVGGDGVIQTSIDGKKWDFRQIVSGKTLNAVAYGGGQFIAIGDDGFLSRSSDGKIWNSLNTGLSKNFKGISYANGRFTAVGQYGAIATSSNGFIWVMQPPVTTKMLKSVAFGNGKWVAVGSDGVVLYQIAGIPWMSLSLGYGINFNHVLFANGQFVAVGVSGKIYTSLNGIAWTSRVTEASTNLRSIMHSGKQFVAVGEPATEDYWGWFDAIIVTSPNNNPAITNVGFVSATPDPQARIAASGAEPEVLLQAMTYPNPVEEEFTVNIEGASGQNVRLWLVDVQGRTIEDREIQVEMGQHNESMHLKRREPGIYLLRVSTADQFKTLKVLKK